MNSRFLPLWMAAILFALGFSFSCAEKSKTPTPTSSKDDAGGTDGGGEDEGGEDEGGEDEGGEDEGGEDEGGEDEGGEDDAAEDFDLCKSLKKASGLPESLVTDACGTGDHSIKTLRGSYFKGGSSAKITSEAEEKGELSAMRISSAMLIEGTKVADYWKMEQMKFFKPEDFKAKFDVHPDTTYTKDSGEVEDGEVSFTFENTEHSPDGIVHYKAKSKFVVLKEGKAYAIGTEFVEKIEGVDSLKGLVIMADKDGDTEVFSMSEQDLNNSGDHDATVDRANGSAKDEQKRSYDNGKKADQAEL